MWLVLVLFIIDYSVDANKMSELKKMIKHQEGVIKIQKEVITEQKKAIENAK